MTDRDKLLFERAIVLIMDEWGKTREEALAWLNDDEADWTLRPHVDCPTEIDGKPAFMQVTRVSNCAPPGFTPMQEKFARDLRKWKESCGTRPLTPDDVEEMNRAPQ